MSPGKTRELSALLGDLPFQLVPLMHLPGAMLPEEPGHTYADNARFKASAAARMTGALALADDSGLEVDALGGAPGPRSARFGGSGLDDAARCRLLLELLRDVPDAGRTARFRCVVAVVDPSSSEERMVAGVAEGLILRAPRGTGGFGYDPIFYYPLLGRTFAELTDAEKNGVSHRAHALSAARRLLHESYTRSSG
jgi:XTP/dITP diphosphohydrolase